MKSEDTKNGIKLEMSDIKPNLVKKEEDVKGIIPRRPAGSTKKEEDVGDVLKLSKNDRDEEDFLGILDPGASLNPDGVHDTVLDSFIDRSTSVPNSVPPKAISHNRRPIPTDKNVIQMKKEDYKKLSFLKNSKLKIKTVEERQLSPDTIWRRLSPVGLDVYEIPLEKSQQEHAFPRRFIQTEKGYNLGGSIRLAFPNIAEKRHEKTGLRNFAYANIDLHVHAPQVPGAPGLFFFIGRDRMEHTSEPMHTFTKLQGGDAGAEAVWCYMGLYQFSGAPPLTKEEWATQTPKVLSAWARKIHSAKWGVPICARIACRKRGRKKPTKAEENAAIKNKSYLLVTEEEIKKAYATGEETVKVSAMKCVGYNTDLQLDLIGEFKTWGPKADKTSGKRKRGENQGRVGKVKKQKTT
ncbi:hypothetical protein BDN72DRAFT_177815 [Pluteus cervinus]|uniref:Uncharacterized protein n=1 Tax=Pluteus cervinus TaxID=181527 RepID=A0ACD3AJJ2_9AGAR|nr:hypothetical protein BDN72DRAFT_177815 [Pluteus cervinus]